MPIVRSWEIILESVGFLLCMHQPGFNSQHPIWSWVLTGINPEHRVIPEYFCVWHKTKFQIVGIISSCLGIEIEIAVRTGNST